MLFHFIQWTWGFPQNFIGLTLLPLLRGRRFRYHGALITLYRPVRFLSNEDGFSLGTFIFMPEGWSEYDRKHLAAHEYGHTVQSLILGPFYLFAVAIPSVIWVRVYGRRREIYRTRQIAYTDRFPENWADRLGEYSTGDKPY